MCACRFTWHVDDVKHSRDAQNERMIVRSADEGDVEHFIELSSLDATGQGASAFLNELNESLEHNKRIEPRGLPQLYEAFFEIHGITDVDPRPWAENWPIRCKRGPLSVAIGRSDPRPLWVQVSGLVLSYYEKPEVWFHLAG